MHREHEINVLIELEQKLCSCCSWSWDLEYTGLVTSFGSVPFVPWGTSRRFGRSKNIHNEKASIFHETLEVGVKDAVNSGAATRIGGDPSWNWNFGKYMEWAAVDTFVKLTKSNVDTAHTSGKHWKQAGELQP